MHGEIKNVKGTEIDIWQEKAEKFITDMTNIIAKILESEKNKK